jgi:threonine/homoserine/homoserine lactone efflux protein
VLDILGETLPLAVGIALSPLPILAVVLLLVAPSGESAGAAFLAGRLMGVLLLVGLFAVMSDVIELSSGDASPFVAVTRIIVGVALAFLAIGKWSRRPGPEEEPELPGWMTSIEDSTAGRGFRLAFLLSVANPKELLLGLGAGFALGSAGLPLGATMVTVLVFTLIACLSVVTPVVAFLVASERMRGPLASARTLLVRHNAVIMSVVLLIIAAALIGGGIADL